MSLNLITDSWIPVLRDGEHTVIRPDQIAEPGVGALAWQRADFNLACLELLIGLVSMADPPKDEADWLSRLGRTDAERFREALAPFAPCFALDGDGPRFLQDMEAFELVAKPSDIKPVDMLHIDSAGGSTTSKNADLMVKRDRFPTLSPAEAAMALYTLQAFAPAGGAGNRTSMRGGGPMVTLVRPLDEKSERFSLWRLVFANVLPGAPLAAEDAEAALPWLRPTRTSENGQIVTQEGTHSLEAFFGMPRRLRFVFKEERVVGVVQRSYGTNYAAWEHPLTPYYRKKEDDPEWLPVHPRAGRLSYRNWLGLTMEPAGDGKATRRTARAVRECRSHFRGPDFELVVGGWAMDNMKPLDFLLDQYPAFPGLGEDEVDRVRQLVEAANAATSALRKALRTACQFDGKFADAVIETFFAETEGEFIAAVRRIIDSAGTEVEEAWHRTLRKQAVRMFDERALGGLIDHDIKGIEARVIARSKLLGMLAKQVRKLLDLPVPAKKKKEKQA
ncbi:MAG: type I-E CRISPR-associated protein Cse1/CasA [Nitrospinae bacterium]|nr:type I-E CRISPR-associated protein Cse1/CasA [Nitrospinota bacterium]